MILNLQSLSEECHQPFHSLKDYVIDYLLCFLRIIFFQHLFHNIEFGFIFLTFCLNRFLLDKTIDVLLYVDRLDVYRTDNLDKQVVKAITDSFGKQIWRRGVVVLTHGQLSPPDGLNYENFFSRRSEALMRVVRLGAGIRKQDLQVHDFSTSRRLFRQVF